MPKRHIPIEKRIFRYYSINRVNNCWEWTNKLDRDGYGSISERINGRLKTHRAHRIMYELTVGQIPKGLVIHHRCENRKCVNPSHLMAITNAENINKSTKTMAVINRQKTSCWRGHPLSGGNMDVDAKGKRVCLSCVWLNQYTYRKRKKEGIVTEQWSKAKLLDNSNNKCTLCNKTIDSNLRYPHPKSFSLQHKIPRSKGGLHKYRNLASSHLICNIKQGLRIQLIEELA